MLITITRETIKKITLKHIVNETKTLKCIAKKKNVLNTKDSNNEGMERKKHAGNTDNNYPNGRCNFHLTSSNIIHKWNKSKVREWKNKYENVMELYSVYKRYNLDPDKNKLKIKRLKNMPYKL